VAKLAPWIRHVHIKDALPSKKPGVEWGEETPWGDGKVGAAAFLAALDKVGYKGALAVEREGGSSRTADIALAVRRLRAL
jgi:sugar phosphate isomerase/epimerase